VNSILALTGLLAERLSSAPDQKDEAIALHAGEGHAVLLSAILPPGRLPFVQVNRPLHPYRLVRSIAHFVLSSLS
jgi:hypothetical protein